MYVCSMPTDYSSTRLSRYAAANARRGQVASPEKGRAANVELQHDGLLARISVDALHFGSLGVMVPPPLARHS